MMNIDTDVQYALTRAIAGHFFKNYDGVLKVDGEVGHKKAYDPRSYLTLADTATAERVKQAVKELRLSERRSCSEKRNGESHCVKTSLIFQYAGWASAASPLPYPEAASLPTQSGGVFQTAF